MESEKANGLTALPGLRIAKKIVDETLEDVNEL